MALTPTLAQEASLPIVPDAPTAIARYLWVSENDAHRCLGISDETHMAILMQKDDAEARAFMETTLSQVTEQLAESTTLGLLPINTLEGQVVHSRMGFPVASMRKASKASNHERFASIEVAVLASKTISSELTTEHNPHSNSPVRTSETQHSTEFYPTVQITLKLADAGGRTITKLKGIYTHPERVEVSSRSVDLTVAGSNGGSTSVGIEGDQRADEIPYYTFLDLAVQDLVKQLPQK